MAQPSTRGRIRAPSNRLGPCYFGLLLVIRQSSRALFTGSVERQEKVASFHAADAHAVMNGRLVILAVVEWRSVRREPFRGAGPGNIIEGPPMTPTVPLDLAKAELEKVLGSPSFRRSPKLSGFLRFVPSVPT